MTLILSLVTHRLVDVKEFTIHQEVVMLHEIAMVQNINMLMTIMIT